MWSWWFVLYRSRFPLLSKCFENKLSQREPVIGLCMVVSPLVVFYALIRWSASGPDHWSHPTCVSLWSVTRAVFLFGRTMQFMICKKYLNANAATKPILILRPSFDTNLHPPLWQPPHLNHQHQLSDHVHMAQLLPIYAETTSINAHPTSLTQPTIQQRKPSSPKLITEALELNFRNTYIF